MLGTGDLQRDKAGPICSGNSQSRTWAGYADYRNDKGCGIEMSGC